MDSDRQNSEIAMAQIEQSRSQELVAWRRQGVPDPGISQLLLQFPSPDPVKLTSAEASPAWREALASMTPSDQLPARAYYLADFYEKENLFDQYERGLISDSCWDERVRATLRRARYLRVGPNGERFLTARKTFIEEIERELAEHDAQVLEERALQN